MIRSVLLAIACLCALATTSAGASCDDPFECHISKPSSRYPLSVAKAKIETRRRASIEASSWDYPGYVMISVASRCTRKAPRALNCRFSVYDIGGAPQGSRKSCHYVAHVILPKNERRLHSAVETIGCEFH